MLVNTAKKTIVAKKVEFASTFWEKFKGLMFRKEFSQENCLIILQCNSIHTCFMNFPLDIIFLNKENRVVHLIEGIKPYKISPIIKEACFVVELAAGCINRSHTEVGDTLSFL
jgi:uncharacterized membrane protein (UPF0127 family)